MMKPVFMIALLLLCGCQGSTLQLLSSPERKNVMIDDREIAVIPRGNNLYTSIEVYSGLAPNIMEFKVRQIEAVEKFTGCKVVDTERVENFISWHMRVDCKKK